jgi:branched-chain amino acid transport system permease protein
MGLSFAICAIAGIAYGMTSQFNPLSGPPRLLIAFEAVVIGGVGSLRGTLLGALLLGIVQSIGASFDPALQHFSGHVLFLITLLIRPNGLFNR